MEELSNYDAFTDIEFNPQKSFSCQAEAVSIFIGLINAKVDISKVLSSKEMFLETIYNYETDEFKTKTVSQQNNFLRRLNFIGNK